MHKIFVAGHRGMVGGAICRVLDERASKTNEEIAIVTASRSELDLCDQSKVTRFFEHHNFNEVYLAAAKVGGILANSTFPADFIYENLSIQNNVIHASYQTEVEKLLFLGSSCIYPKYADQPMKESYLLTGQLEKTNEPYAIAKIAGLKMCESFSMQYGCDFRSVMPTNLYGPGDNFHPDHSHVIPGLMYRYREAIRQNADEIVIWGSGNPKREFLHVDDMASACVHVMNMQKEQYVSTLQETLSHINIGTGNDCSIKELAMLMMKITGFPGQLVFDDSKPDGTPRKLLDVGKLHESGWSHGVSLEVGLRETWDWYLKNHE